MNKIILAAALSLLTTTAAFAEATTTLKGTTSNGSIIGFSASAFTGNGDVVGGNGTGAFGPLNSDQTTGPGTRSDAVHDLQDAAKAGGFNPGKKN